MNKHQLETVVVKWLNRHFGNLTPKTSSTYPRSVFYINSGNEIIKEIKKTNIGYFIFLIILSFNVSPLRLIPI